MGPVFFVIGIDGGGSRTQALLADGRGRVLRKAGGPPSNPNVVGEEGSLRVLGQVAAHVLKEAGLTGRVAAALCLGLAGLKGPDESRRYENYLVGLGIAEKVRVESDAVTALCGATACRPGVVVIAGTGSVAFGMHESGERFRAGGWGSVLGDEGSGFDIGMRAMKAVLRDFDGRGPATRMASGIFEFFQVSGPAELYERSYRPGFRKDQVAALVPLVVEAARQGDAVAAGILAAAGKELGAAAAAVLRRLSESGKTFPVTYSGGVFGAGALILESFTAEVHRHFPQVTVQPAAYPPVYGAVLLALRQVGLEPDAGGEVLK